MVTKKVPQPEYRIESRWVRDGQIRWSLPFHTRELATDAFVAAVRVSPYPYGPNATFRLVLIGPGHKPATRPVTEGPAL